MMMNRMNTNAIRTQRVEEIMSREPLALSPMMRAGEALARLRTLASTTDGFRIAEEDLKARGPGDFFGSRQHGLPQLRLASLTGDMELLAQTQQAARELLEADPELIKPENAPVLARVRALFAETLDIFN